MIEEFENMKKIYQKSLVFVMIIVNLYGFSLFAMAPYYNWRYANEHGFVKWLFFGEVIATVKSVIGPYFLFFCTAQDISNFFG